MKVKKAYEYAKDLPKNTLSTKQWEILKDPEGLLGDFLERWKRDNTLTPVIISNSDDHVGKAFDMIIELESGIIKS